MKGRGEMRQKRNPNEYKKKVNKTRKLAVEKKEKAYEENAAPDDGDDDSDTTGATEEEEKGHFRVKVSKIPADNNYDEVHSGDENEHHMESSESKTGDSRSDQDDHYSEDECEYDDEKCDHYYQDYIEDRNRELRKKLHKSSQPRMTSILTGSKSTANKQMHKVNEPKQANDGTTTNSRYGGGLCTSWQ
jgi:hypothetical protein